MKITEFPKVTELKKTNVFLLDGPDGTKGIMGEHFPFEVMNLAGAEIHRMFFRGKNLGGSLTTAQKAAIQDGSFKDLWLGDYWTIGGIRWRIWDFDYWLNCGDTSFTKHHLVIMPDTCLYNAQMNTSNVTTGGYVGSAMYTSNLANAKTTFRSAFGDALLTHRNLFVNAVSNGRPSAGAWYDSVVDLPNEPMMYGSHFFVPGSDGSNVPYRYTIDKQQLALAQYGPRFVNIRATYWLRDVVSSAYFALVNYVGNTFYANASSSCGVRPVAAVG